MPIRFDYDRADLDTLAQPLTLLDTDRKRLVASNRIVYQPMEGNDAGPDGAPSQTTMARYTERANGFAGIDHVEALSVSRAGRARGDQLVIDRSTQRGYEWLVKKYRHANRKTPLLFQLTHSGRFSEQPVTPYPLPGQAARLLTDADMPRIQRDFVEATRIAYECGADGIDFKHCHGYLCGALLGKANRARAGWSFGGESLFERARFCTDTLAAMMDAVPPDRFLYTVRLSAFEGIPGGFGSKDAASDEEDETYAELVAFCRRLERAGIAVLNQSSGVPELTPLLVRQTNENPLGFFAHQERARIMKQAVGVPVIGSGYSYPKVGHNRLPGEDRSKKTLTYLGARAIREGGVDLIGIGRQCLSEPYFAAKLLSERIDEIRWDTSCNQCAVSLRAGIHAGCVTYDIYYKDLFRRMKAARAGG